MGESCGFEGRSSGWNPPEEPIIGVNRVPRRDWLEVRPAVDAVDERPPMDPFAIRVALEVAGSRECLTDRQKEALAALLR